jgi:hypothetical protein
MSSGVTPLSRRRRNTPAPAVVNVEGIEVEVVEEGGKREERSLGRERRGRGEREGKGSQTSS